MMSKQLYYIYAMLLLCSTLCTGCGIVSNIVSSDPRCQPRQYCAYTDAPSPIRTEVIRNK